MTAGGTVNAGSRATAVLMRGVAPNAAYKGSNQTVTSSTTLQNDNTLFVPVLASAVYRFDCMLTYQGGTQGSSDLKFAFVGPSGTTMAYSVQGITTAGVATAGYVRALAGMAVGSNGGGNSFAVTMTGSVSVGSTAGTLQLQWAQNTSNATGTIVQAGSILTLWQVQ